MAETKRESVRQVAFSHGGNLYKGILRYKGSLVKEDKGQAKPVVLNQDTADALMAVMGVAE